MHELSIAQSLIEIALDQCSKSGYTRIDQIKVRIGKGAGVLADSLRFGFDALKEGTAAGQAVLEIEEVPITGRCSACNLDFTSEESYVLNCPHCGSPGFTLLTGRELMIAEMEVN